jgi:hypothetical protein
MIKMMNAYEREVSVLELVRELEKRLKYASSPAKVQILLEIDLELKPVLKITDGFNEFVIAKGKGLYDRGIEPKI